MATPTADKFCKANEAQSFGAYAESYGKYFAILSAPLASRICELAELKPGENVLDVASGTGVSSRAAAKIAGTAGNVTGIDFSEEMVRIAAALSSNYSNMTFLQMDAEQLDLPDERFDSVISSFAILHFPNVEKAIAEMFRVVRPGGKVVVSFGAGHPLRGKELARHKARRVSQVLRHKCLFAPAFLCNLAAKELGRGHADGVLTAWSKNQPDKHIIKKMAAAGFRNIEFSWHGHDVEFASPNMYWEAQTAIVTDVRRRLEKADSSVEEKLKGAFLSEAKKVIASGGKLLYPFGAVFIKATKPIR